MGCEYSLIVLWPHTDECDRTAERGEGDKSHRTFRAIADKSGRRRILNHLPLTFGYLDIHHQGNQRQLSQFL